MGYGNFVNFLLPLFKQYLLKLVFVEINADIFRNSFPALQEFLIMVKMCTSCIMCPIVPGPDSGKGEMFLSVTLMSPVESQVV